MNDSFAKRLRYFLELTKLKIMLPVTLTGFTGYFIYEPHLSLKIFLVSIGILLVAVAASVLNQIQEVEPDRKMNRTQNRPLPSGSIKIHLAWLLFLTSLTAGAAILWLTAGMKPAIIALFTVLWYNGIYTCSKRFTAFAVVPGAITGALPPLIGWVAAGGGVWDKPILFLEFLFFTGQIPHFWLLISQYGEEYNKAGFPSLTRIFTRQQINRLTFTWVICSVIAALFLSHFEIIHTGLITALLLAASAFLIWQFSGLVIPGEKKDHYGRYSFLLNSYFLLIMILLVADKII